jgi:hypothetical protein
VAGESSTNSGASGADHCDVVDPPSRLRLPLSTIDDVKREMARLYREGKSGRRDVSAVSRLANVLALLGRLIEGAELEARLAALEAKNGNKS